MRNKNSGIIVLLISVLLFGGISSYGADKRVLARGIRSADESTRDATSREIEKLVQTKQIGQISTDSNLLIEIGDVATRENNPTIKNRLVIGMVATKNPSVVPSLAVIAKSPGSRDVRSVALQGLAVMGGQEAKNTAHEIYLNEKDVLLKLRAAKVLAKFGDEQGLQETMKQLNSSSSRVGIEAVETLGAFNAQEARKRLISLASQPNAMGATAQVSLKEIELRQYTTEESKFGFLKKSLFTSDQSSGWAAQKLFELRTPEAIQFLLDTARTKPVYGTPEYFAKQNAERSFRSLYHDGTAAGYSKIEKMMQSGVVTEKPKD